MVMKIEIDTRVLISSSISPNCMVLLYLLYKKELKQIVTIFGKTKALELRNELINTKYLLSGETKFTDTVISKKEVEKLFGLRGDEVNFWEFYNEYPVRVGSRVLRAAGPTTAIALKHQEKYLKRVKTVEQHELAIESIRAFVAMQKRANKLSFLPNMETVMNNSMWEMWCSFIQEVGTEEQEWNNNAI
jgi:hypothetical protein